MYSVPIPTQAARRAALAFLPRMLSSPWVARHLYRGLTAAVVKEGGLIGDRAYALIDNATGKIASAKNPRKWARLFDCHASFIEPPRKDHSMPPVRIMLPDGSNIRSDQQNTNGILSRFFERDVTLAETAPDSPALEEYWPDIDGLAHCETVTEESIALSAPKGSFLHSVVVTYFGKSNFHTG